MGIIRGSESKKRSKKCKFKTANGAGLLCADVIVRAIVDKYEYKARAEEIRRLIAEKQYREAEEIADTIDWRNVPNGMMLCTVSDLYKICRRYEDSRDVLLLAYQRNPKGKMIIYSLCELSIKLEDVVNAVEYYKEYLQVAPTDSGKYILQYKLYEAQGASLEERASILEEYTSHVCREKWMYELAYLYHRIGLGSSCVEVCNQIIIYFGEGKYVVKALELKALHEPLTPEQQSLFNRLTGKVEEEIVVKDINVGKYNTIDLQRELADNLKEVLFDDGTSQPAKEKIPTTVIGDVSIPVSGVTQDTIVVGSPAEVTQDTIVIGGSEEATKDTIVTGEPAEVTGDTTVINVSEEVKASEQTESVDEQQALDTVSGAEANQVQEAKADEASENSEPENEMIDMAAMTVKISDPDITEINPPSSVGEDNKSQISDPVSLTDTLVYSREEVEKALGGSKVIEEPEAVEEPAIKPFTHTAPLEFNFDDVLSLEGDGQISLVVPEQDMLEKQITGQLSIDEVLLEYEKIRRDTEEKWANGIRSKIMQSTDNMFRDFDESRQNGLLEQLEESVEADPDSVAYGPNLTEEEVIYLEEELEAQNAAASAVAATEAAQEAVSTEAVAAPQEEVIEIIEEAEPTPQELFFDRTPYISNTDDAQETENVTEPEQETTEAVQTEQETSEAAQTEQEASAEDSTEAAATDNTETAAGDSDYLMKFAQAGMEKDLEEQQAIEAFEQAMQQMIAEEEAKVQSKDVPAEADSQEADSNEEETVYDENGEVVAEPVNEVGEEDTTPVGEVKEDSPEEFKPDFGIVSDNTDNLEAVQEALKSDSGYDDGFTDEQWERFESFIQHEVGREQVRTALTKLSGNCNTGNVIIGSPDTDSAIELGRMLIMEQKEAGNVTGKSGVIKASVLNAKDAEVSLSKIYDGAVIIQDAEELRPETLKGIQKVLSDPDKKMQAILIVSKRHKHKFIMDNSKYLESFTISIDNEPLVNSELVKLAEEYANAQEFSIDEMGILALHRIIDERQTNSHSVLLKEVKDIVDGAIAHASKKNMGHFFDLLFGRRYDKNDMIILGEKDFIE